MDIGSIAALVGNGPARYLIESIGNVNSQVLTSMHRDFIPVLGEEGDTEIFSFYETLESPTAQEPGEGKDVSNVSRILGGLAQRATKAPNRTRTDTMFIVPYPENPTFIGRHEAIEAIKRQFGLPKPHQNSKPRTRVAIYGLGGIGKTQVALAFVYWLQSALPDIAVLWVHSSRADRFRQDYVKIAQAYNIPGFGDPKVNVLQHVKTWLETKLRTRWLMVLDNADDLETFFHETDEDDFGISVQDGISRYIPECSHGFILTTTRDKKLGVRIAPGKPPISVGPMGEHESHEYLCKTLDDGTISTADTSALASKLEHLPLAISQAATYITENTITIQKYLQVLDNSDEVLTRRLGEPFAAVGRDSETPHAVTATWILSFRQIEKTSPLGAELLSVMSLYHWQGIPRVLLEKYRENKEGKDKITIPSDIFESSIGTLKAFSLISENKDGELSMHRLVHLVTRNWRLDRKKSNVGVESDYALLASVSLADVLPKNGKDTRGSCLLLLPHAEEIFSTDLGSHEYERLSRGEIALRIGKYCLEEGQWDRAATWHCRAFQAFSRLLGEKNPKSLESGLNLAQAYRSQGQWAKAESLQLEINKSSQEHLEADDPLIQRGMDNLARIYMSQEKFEEAERIHIRLMESFEAKYGSNHAKTLDIMNSLAINYRRQKRLEDAERLQLKLMERSNPNVGNVQNNLAMIYVDQGRWDEAEELLTHAIKDAEKLQEESPFAWSELVESLYFTTDEEINKKYKCALSGLRSWLTEGKTAELPAYLTSEDDKHYEDVFSDEKGGYGPAIN
ncbi:hypothetical protein NW762_009130 [Fusarium torreyae]|uniref:DUF7779 domain-containing protein n=1 Tax=Fusarium torreyae TaxID=1237075 RepID=A0A9W8VCL3_9HYPO|nr:hypothetical protein NW762_009130 [Fusarium torreyae]